MRGAKPALTGDLRNCLVVYEIGPIGGEPLGGLGRREALGIGLAKPLFGKYHLVEAAFFRRVILAAFILAYGTPLFAQTLPSPSSALATPSATSEPKAWGAFKCAWTTVSSYSARVTLFERKGTRVQHSVVDYTFRKPSSATLHIIAGPDAGVTGEWNGGATVQLRRGRGLLGLFKKTFSLHDPQVTSIRGSSLDQLSFGAFLAHADATPGRSFQSAAPGIPGIPSEAVTLVASSAIADTGLTREVFEISSITHLPFRVLGYERRTLVRQIDFADLTVNYSKLNGAIGSRCAALEAG